MFYKNFKSWLSYHIKSYSIYLSIIYLIHLSIYIVYLSIYLYIVSIYLYIIYLSFNLIIYLSNLSHLYLFYILFYFIYRSYGRFVLVFFLYTLFSHFGYIHNHIPNMQIILLFYINRLRYRRINLIWTYIQISGQCRHVVTIKSLYLVKVSLRFHIHNIFKLKMSEKKGQWYKVEYFWLD